jgi:hypothetical protein
MSELAKDCAEQRLGFIGSGAIGSELAIPKVVYEFLKDAVGELFEKVLNRSGFDFVAPAAAPLGRRARWRGPCPGSRIAIAEAGLTWGEGGIVRPIAKREAGGG